MGQSGVDVVLSPSAKKIVDLVIECKNREQLVVPTVFKEHNELYKNQSGLKLLIHTRNRAETLVTLRWEDFVGLLKHKIENEQSKQSNKQVNASQ